MRKTTRICVGDVFGKWTVIECDKEIEKGKRRKCKCRCECGYVDDIGERHLKRGDSTQCKYCRAKNAIATTFKDLTGTRIGRLTILELSQNRKNDRVTWKCLCDCGKIVDKIIVDSLNYPRGCGRCNTYREIKGNYWVGMKAAAAKRGIPFEITLEYAWNLYESQDKKCALTKVDINFKSKKDKGNASLDRKDSSKGYVEGNVQWIHKVVNLMKYTLTNEEFISICKTVSEAHKEFSMTDCNFLMNKKISNDIITRNRNRK